MSAETMSDDNRQQKISITGELGGIVCVQRVRVRILVSPSITEDEKSEKMILKILKKDPQLYLVWVIMTEISNIIQIPKYFYKITH